MRPVAEGNEGINKDDFAENIRIRLKLLRGWCSFHDNQADKAYTLRKD